MHCHCTPLVSYRLQKSILLLSEFMFRYPLENALSLSYHLSACPLFSPISVILMGKLVGLYHSFLLAQTLLRCCGCLYITSFPQDKNSPWNREFSETRFHSCTQTIQTVHRCLLIWFLARSRCIWAEILGQWSQGCSKMQLIDPRYRYMQNAHFINFALLDTRVIIILNGCVYKIHVSSKINSSWQTKAV